MAIFPFRKTSSGDEKTGSPQEDIAVAQTYAEPEVDEDHDDLHRGMKPRQLSMSPLALGYRGAL